jgi:hypothetical protein
VAGDAAGGVGGVEQGRRRLGLLPADGARAAQVYGN